MIVSVIAAVSENGVIGKSNELAWNLPDELQYFRDVTRGKPVVMGRKTAESIMAVRQGQLLPGRHNIVISANHTVAPVDADVVSTIDEAIEMAKEDHPDELFIIGGGQTYEATLPMADRLYLTRVHTDIEGGDAFFPAFNESDWELVRSDRHEADERHAYPFTMMVYERKKQ